MFELNNKKALVTGGNGGIGLGMAKGLANAGAAVAICGRSEEKNASALEELSSIHSGCRVFAFDLENLESIPETYREISQAMNGIDILINNAGVQHRGRADEIALVDFETVMKVNVTAPYLFSQHFARERISMNKTGSIIFTASLMSEMSRPCTSAYTTSKGAVRQMIKALAVDWAEFGIRVNGIGPGYVKTEMTRLLYEDPSFNEWVEKRTPLSRWGLPSDYAGAAVFLSSQAADFITGQILYIDGGWLATF